MCTANMRLASSSRKPTQQWGEKIYTHIHNFLPMYVCMRQGTMCVQGGVAVDCNKFGAYVTASKCRIHNVSVTDLWPTTCEGQFAT